MNSLFFSCPKPIKYQNSLINNISIKYRWIYLGFVVKIDIQEAKNLEKNFFRVFNDMPWCVLFYLNLAYPPSLFTRYLYVTNHAIVVFSQQ